VVQPHDEFPTEMEMMMLIIETCMKMLPVEACLSAFRDGYQKEAWAIVVSATQFLDSTRRFRSVCTEHSLMIKIRRLHNATSQFAADKGSLDVLSSSRTRLMGC
jgi:hypothetical protein